MLKVFLKPKKKDLSAVDGIGEIRAKQIKDFNQFKDAEDEIKFTEASYTMFISYKQRLSKTLIALLRCTNYFILQRQCQP